MKLEIKKQSLSMHNIAAHSNYRSSLLEANIAEYVYSKYKEKPAELVKSIVEDKLSDELGKALVKAEPFIKNMGKESGKLIKILILSNFDEEFKEIYKQKSRVETLEAVVFEILGKEVRTGLRGYELLNRVFEQIKRVEETSAIDMEETISKALFLRIERNVLFYAKHSVQDNKSIVEGIVKLEELIKEGKPIDIIIKGLFNFPYGKGNGKKL